MTLTNQPEWMDRAACRGRDPRIFMGTEKDPEIHKRHAVKICRHCPVTLECRQYAISIDADGMWGGSTKAQRVAIALRSRKNLATSASERRDLEVP